MDSFFMATFILYVEPINALDVCQVDLYLRFICTFNIPSLSRKEASMCAIQLDKVHLYLYIHLDNHILQLLINVCIHIHELCPEKFC